MPPLRRQRTPEATRRKGRVSRASGFDAGLNLTAPGGMASIVDGSDNLQGRVCTMTWETPGFVEVRMDAEMTAYADDLDGI